MAAAAAGARGAGAGAAGPGHAMLTRPIPSSGERLPAVGLGTSGAFDVGAAPAERDPLREVLRGFVARGGRVVDSSPMYGTAETVVGDLASELGLLASLWVATKVWTQGRQAGLGQVERSLQCFRVKRLDLVQVHNLVDWQTHLRTLREWKETGRVRGIAVLVNRPSADGALFQRVRGHRLPPWAADLGCASWGQFFLKWILAHPAVTCVIPATSKPEHLADNMGAGAGALPDSAARERMAAHLAAL